MSIREQIDEEIDRELLPEDVHGELMISFYTLENGTQVLLVTAKGKHQPDIEKMHGAVKGILQSGH